MTHTRLPPLAINSRAALDNKLAEHDDALNTLETSKTTDEANVAALQIATKWLYAATKPTVHMAADLEGLDALTNLASNANNATQNARAVALNTAWVAHIAGVGTVTVNDEHKAADATNVIAHAAPTDTTTRIAWIAAAKTAIIGHGNQSGVHFLDDSGAGGTGFTLSVDPPVTDADCAADLNDILTGMKTHFNIGAAVLPPSP